MRNVAASISGGTFGYKKPPVLLLLSSSKPRLCLSASTNPACLEQCEIAATQVLPDLVRVGGASLAVFRAGDWQSSCPGMSLAVPRQCVPNRG